MSDKTALVVGVVALGLLFFHNLPAILIGVGVVYGISFLEDIYMGR